MRRRVRVDLRTRNRIVWPVLAALSATFIALDRGTLWFHIIALVVCCAFAVKWWRMPADRVHTPPGRWF